MFDQIKAVLLKSNLHHGTKIKKEGQLEGESEVTSVYLYREGESAGKNPTAHAPKSIHIHIHPYSCWSQRSLERSV